MGKNEYKSLILTNHAIDRISQRAITEEDIWQTYKSPDFQEERKNNAVLRSKRFKNYEISIIYKYSTENKPIILSVWMEPPIPGSKDAKEKEWWGKYKRAGFWGKIFLTFQKQIGL